MGTGEFTAGGNPGRDEHPIQGGLEILLVALCYRNRYQLWPDRPLCSHYRLDVMFFDLIFSDSGWL